MKLLSNTPSKHFGSSFIPEDVLWDCLSIFSFFFIPVWMPFHRVTFLTSPSFSIVPSLFFMSGPPFIPFSFFQRKIKIMHHTGVCVCVYVRVCVYVGGGPVCEKKRQVLGDPGVLPSVFRLFLYFSALFNLPGDPLLSWWGNELQDKRKE